jgi:hypothetical protein
VRVGCLAGRFIRTATRGRKLLKPLRQWICDECQRVIRAPEQGWVEWLIESKSRKQKGFRIVHFRAYSPRRPQAYCHVYREQRKQGGADVLVDEVYLTHFVDRGPTPILLSFIDPGPHVEREYAGPKVADLREWTEFARRLTIPYYEQARLYLDRAAREGFFNNSYEPEIYYPATLKRVIDRYSP